MAVLGARDAAAEGAGPGAATGGLAALHRSLNEHDPHFRYDFAVSGVNERETFVPVAPPRMLIFTAQKSHDDICVTWNVYARCDESLRERPIPLHFSLSVDANLEIREALQAFIDYGKPFEVTDGSVLLNMDLPGGLGATFEQGSVKIGPTKNDADRSYVLRLRAVLMDGTVTPAVRLNMSAPTVGARGARLFGVHSGGSFSFEAFHDIESATMSVSFRLRDLTASPS